MTTPNYPGASRPPGTLEPGLFRPLQEKTVDQAKATMSGGIMGAFEHTQDELHQNYNTPIGQAYDTAVSAQGSADVAVSTAQAAANAAANAEDVADAAYFNASYWITECVVASAEVLLGVNELLLGPVLNVPSSQDAILTDIHIALLEQPNGMTIETRKWNAAGTSWTTVATTVLGANVTRHNVPLLSVPVLDKERVFYYITSITGSVPPQVLQIAVAGVFTPAEV